MAFNDYILWDGIIHFAGLAVLLLFANTLRRKIPFLRRSLLPTAVIAGFIGLVLKETVYIRIVTDAVYDNSLHYLRMITYHSIALGFIALGLKVNEKMIVKGEKNTSFYSGLIIVSTYLLQGFFGLLLSLAMAYTLFPDLFSAAGMLLPMGFGQGPGQAQNIGGIYEITYGFAGGTSFGLAIASFGFIWATVAGVIYLNMLAKKGEITRDSSARTKLLSSQEIEAPDEIPVAESIDKFTIQVTLVLMVYLVTYLFMFGFNTILEAGIFGEFGISTVIPLIWGFNFIFGMLFALLFRQIFIWLRKVNIMTRQYPNNYMLNRITGFVFDFMIVASISAIRIEDLSGLWIPFFILVIVVGYVTLRYVKFMAARVYPSYKHAATLGMFGMLTGTASTGVILIREVDPTFQTPAANDLVIGSSTAILFGFPVLLLVGIAPLSIVHTLVTFGLIILLLIITVSILLKFNPKQKA